MSSDLSTKVQNVLWWITSIATAVVCCSVIFVLFASYFVDVRNDIKSGNMRMNMIEEREDKILAELESIRKHGLVGEATLPAPTPVVAAPAATPAQVPSPASVEITTPAPTTSPAPDMPAASAPQPAQTPATPTPATVFVPVITTPPMAPTAPDKK